MRRSNRRGLHLRACLVAMATGSLMAAGASAASAATFVVGTTSDDASGVAAHCAPGASTPCSLRDAITAANAADSPSSAPDEIQIPAGTYTSANSTLPSITDNVNIRATDPRGAQTTKVNSGSGINGSVLTIGREDASPRVLISGLTVSDGHSSAGGGGIYVFSGTLTLTDSEVTGNRSSTESRGGGGILNDATLIMDRDAVVSNLADGGSGGAGIYNADTATIKDSTISDNVNSTPRAANSGAGSAGGIYNRSFATLTLVNDTIYANRGPTAGGLYLEPTPESLAASAAIGTRVRATGVDIQNTVLAFNQAVEEVITAVRAAPRAATNTSYVDCGGNVSSSSLRDNGNNSDYDNANSCGFSAAKHDLVSIDPLLGALTLNGGSTDNRLPKSGSPVIDTGANVNCPALDQRRLGRPAGASCEIGADEVQVAQTTTPPKITPTPQTGVQAAHAASPTVRITGVPSACVRHAFTIRVNVVTTVPLTSNSLALDGHPRGLAHSISVPVRIDAAALKPGHHGLRATATNASGSGAASAAFTRCRPVVHHRRKVSLRFTG